MKKTDKRFTAKKWITILLAFSLMVSVLPALSLSALAADSLSGTCGDQLRWSFEKGTGKLTVTGSGAMDDYAYDPSADPEGRMVPWYDYLGSIMTVELPEGLTHIGDYSFCGSWISSITIPASVTSIGDAPFYRCRALKEFKVGSGSNTYSTDTGVLLNRDKTEVLLYPPAREGDYVIPDTVVRIGEYAFDSTRITAVTIPEGVSEIAYMAFSCCYELQSVSIPGSVKTVGEEAFFGCHELQSAVMGSGVTGIGDGAFACCSSLEAVRFPDSLEYIGEDAFASCEALTDVIIPENVTFIGSDAFGDCASLQSFTVEPRNPAFCSVEGILFSKDQTELIRYPQAKAGDYQIPSNVEKLGETAFQRCRGLTALTIPSGIKQIPANQFLACENLKSVEIAESVESIGVRAFFGCASLESITIPTGVTEIGTEVFLSCESLKNVKIPDSVTRIGMGAFAACTALEEIRIPGSVSEIESGAFFDCRSLKRVAISDGVTTIGSDAFVWCRQLRNVVLPRSVKQIEQDAFHKCGELGVLTIMNEGCRIDDVNAPEDTIIRGYRGSTAETFAKEHGYVFEALSKETEFADVLEKAFYEKAVVWAVENQVTNGTGEYTFSPDKACTRGQVVTFLWRAAGCPEPEKEETSFTDLKPGAFYEKAVAWAVENGITSGTSETTFSPDAGCTRGQVVTFLWRAAGSPEPGQTQMPFTDLKPGAFYEKAVAWAEENNITNGMTATTFAPDAGCNRGQVVTFLCRTAE